ncbi:GNAT family N-acetyltransferase [Companilactobacillus jidongensis]|uniref:GNAT family N-acetyltransferase n=1 Tax=Companilactobacillus jidongensis TaxID=2486006 RepID=UPI000F7788B9|nr:GNAT family N-acetyltransferase [Companilactobacillus jidongensis]
MKIETYKNNPQTLAGLVDLIEFCQNDEAHLDIKMIEQSDVFEIPEHYQATGGNFWIAKDNGLTVGSIGLLKLDNKNGVLKKFFTYPKYRGNPVRLGQKLYEQFIDYAKNEVNLETIFLDTPEGEQRSHYFYEKQGFKLINRDKLAANYEFPDRNSRIYKLNL